MDEITSRRKRYERSNIDGVNNINIRVKKTWTGKKPTKEISSGIVSRSRKESTTLMRGNKSQRFHTMIFFYDLVSVWSLYVKQLTFSTTDVDIKSDTQCYTVGCSLCGKNSKKRLEFSKRVKNWIKHDRYFFLIHRWYKLDSRITLINSN